MRQQWPQYWYQFLYSRHKKKTTFIGGMELVSLRCNREITSASSYGLGWYKYAIATQWYQFHTTGAWWFSLKTNVALLSIEPLGTKFSEILFKIQYFSFTSMHLKISSAKWRPFCPGGDELIFNIMVADQLATEGAVFLLATVFT